ncbi:hypothetical protein LSTR_LSTR011657 [Laodelphax striatellus]|uniref:FH2 domain-containing protein n=1 Tax=Laodelphax striatellus TaxID=195883 RepID=A0A482WKM9_LAOST|nr:hypothetical protein LSTR_LSTR011657 [Laodelphax striatellus]
MSPRPQELQIDDEVTSVVEGMQISPAFVDNSTQTSTETMTTGIQVASRGVDSWTQTEPVACSCKCNCSAAKSGASVKTSAKSGATVKTEVSAGSVGEMLSKIRIDLKSALDHVDLKVKVDLQDAKKVTSKVSLVIPPPPPLPLTPGLMDKSLPPNFVLNTPAPPPLPVAVSTPISDPQNISADFQTPPPPPPPPPMMGASTFPSMKPAAGVGMMMRKCKTLPAQTGIKMKTINWTKIPKQKIAKSFWSDADVQLPVLRVDFNKMQELFGQKPAKKPLNIKSQLAVRKSKTLNLLDSQRSFLVNIFLKQFKENIEFVLDSIKKGVGLPVDNLKALMKLMPEKKEVRFLKILIRAHASCKSLGEAESFFLHLSDIADYELRIQAMLYKEEFHERFTDASSHLEKVLDTCQFLVNDCSLKQFLTLILQLGNQLNAGTYAGNAAAFKLSSLQMLADTKANKPKMTFLHYVVDVAVSNDASLLDFRTRVADFQEMSKTPIAAVEEEVKTLAEGVNEIHKRLKSSRVSSQFGDFFQNAKKQVDVLVKKLKTIKEMKSQLAVHFCEEPASFQLNECYQLFADFFEKVNTVLEENDQMRKFEEKSAKTKAEKQSTNELVTARRRIFEDSVDQLIIDIQKGVY